MARTDGDDPERRHRKLLRAAPHDRSHATRHTRIRTARPRDVHRRRGPVHGRGGEARGRRDRECHGVPGDRATQGQARRGTPVPRERDSERAIVRAHRRRQSRAAPDAPAGGDRRTDRFDGPLLGETGTGKELLARAIHDRSHRRDRTFVKLNCAAIPSGLLESELFGHERGAFTGAIAQKIGRFQVADGGTLFLDEVGEIPLELQPKLLRVLQEQEFERIGSTKTIKVDVRLIAATNRDLLRMVEEQRFRDDLYYRLNVFPIQAPPLRERPEDIPALVSYFVQRFARPMNRRVEVIPSETLDALRRYTWPGNIRELANLIERAMILSRGRRLEVPLDDLARRRGPAPIGHHDTAGRSIDRADILRALEQANWVLGGPQGTAARLGMKRTTLQSLMKRPGIEKPA